MITSPPPTSTPSTNVKRMQNKGIICLYDLNDNIVNRRTYGSPRGRRAILNDWRKWYGKRFNQLVIHITPSMEGTLRTHPDGTNVAYTDIVKQLHLNRTGSGNQQ